MVKKIDSSRYPLFALKFKTCLILSRNVQKRELTIIQCCILQRLRNKKNLLRERFIKEKILIVTYNHKLHKRCPLFMGIYPSQRYKEEQSELYISIFHSIQKQDWMLFWFVSIFMKLFLKQGSRYIIKGFV